MDRFLVKAALTEVLSEGEQTCVAFAAFLTELATESEKSGLVFDDPITSLDHRWRKKVAERLVKEAQARQVIIFTHDLVFLNDLKDLAEKASVATQYVTISRGALGAGIITEGLPWVGKSVADRLDKLEKDINVAKALYQAGEDESYAAAIFNIYSRLRSTWERALEDTALGNVICRHRDYINTNNLKKITAFSNLDCEQFKAGWGKCCDYTDAHDHSRVRNLEPPSPQEVLQDITALKAWNDGLKARQVSKSKAA